MADGIGALWTEPVLESPKIGERWLVVVGAEDAESRSLEFVGRFAKGDAEIHLAKPSGPDPANEVRRLATALEADLICLAAHRGSGLMSLFLRADVEEVLRASPCPVICIPESFAPAGDRSAADNRKPVRRVLALTEIPSPNRWEIESAVAVAERFAAKLDLLGVDELPRTSEGLRVTDHRAAKRWTVDVIKEELAKRMDELVPQRVRGRMRVSLGHPVYYATTRWARELNSDLIVLAVPTRLWTQHGRIDAGTERILHRTECPVIFIPEPRRLRRSRRVGRNRLLRDRGGDAYLVRRLPQDTGRFRRGRT